MDHLRVTILIYLLRGFSGCPSYALQEIFVRLTTFYDECGVPFTIEHALDCHVEGLVGQRHNEVRDAVGDLASLAWGQMTKEPIVCESSSTDPSSVTLIADHDLQICGVWQPQADVLFDVHMYMCY